MRLVHHWKTLQRRLARGGGRLSRVGRQLVRDERGDVPGWVLVTLMTAGLVVAIWIIAGPALVTVFETAIQRVTSFGG